MHNESGETDQESAASDAIGEDDEIAIGERVEKLPERKKTAANSDEFYNRVDLFYGYQDISPKSTFTAFLLTFRSNQIEVNSKGIQSCLTLYCLGERLEKFKVNLIYNPYLFILVLPGKHREVINYLGKRFEGQFTSFDIVIKEDLDLPNHLCNAKQTAIKISFYTVQAMDSVRYELQTMIKQNMKTDRDNKHQYTDFRGSLDRGEAGDSILKYQQYIIDIREYDVPYHTRFCIDNNLNASKWFCITFNNEEEYRIEVRNDLVERPNLTVFTYDIECTKLPLKFPDKAVDQIMMISFMINEAGYLITNREIISQDIENFGFSPKPDMKSEFEVINCQNEERLLQEFFKFIKNSRPEVFTTYNGDFFDWSFVEARAMIYDINIKDEIGFYAKPSGEFTCHCALHLDCYYWVKRDSYLPFGSHGLKAVAKAKLAYHPIEVDPEEMVKLALQDPVMLSQYSVSDSVATYFLYLKYVQPFIFSLSTILPMIPDEVLRKGTGICCENLLMVEAYKVNVIFPNKMKENSNKFTDDNNLIISETYIGGHVEAIECGIFRSDLLYDFNLDKNYLCELRSIVKEIFENALVNEMDLSMSDITNFDERMSEVVGQLTELINGPKFKANPLIYHLDVGAMYPNIMLTNRLQPTAIVNEVVCAKCDFNKPSSNCKRNMDWKWRGELYPMNKGEISSVKNQIKTEKFKDANTGNLKSYNIFKYEEREKFLKQRLKDYSKKVYKKIHVFSEKLKTSTVCQRENSFYIDTVRLFRDRRYLYKKLLKDQVKALNKHKSDNTGSKSDQKRLESLIVIYDSLQLAHKCILNSFYGYVMRKGSRWHSMETGGIICFTGASIIQQARKVVDCIGRPLELDTDGIWCMIPMNFPDNIKFDLLTGGSVSVNFPNSILNHTVATKFSNEQYQVLENKSDLIYKIKNENSIFFEVDGPYLAMILPASKEEGKTLKKRYAVFNHNRKLQELKGFELKRRGELNMIKYFQENLFASFLGGTSLEGAYQSAAKQANYWLDILDSKCSTLTDEELFNLISETKNMSRKLEDYGSNKSTAITTAKRLSEFLGPKILQDSKVKCEYLISKDPPGKPVSQRSIPIKIFSFDEDIKIKLLSKWLGISLKTDFDIRDILDWQYYRERLSSCIKKIITYPAAFQSIPNPVPKVINDSWVDKMIKNKDSINQQGGLDKFLKHLDSPTNAPKTIDVPQISHQTLSDQVCSQKESKLTDSRSTDSIDPTTQKAHKYSILNYSTNLDDLLLTNVSEILKVQESNKSDHIIVWLRVKNFVTSVTVYTPKIFYLVSLKDYQTTYDYLTALSAEMNLKISIQEARKAIPLRNQIKSVLKIILHTPEDMNNLARLFNNHSFCHSYELLTSSIRKFILYKGMACKISRKMKNKIVKSEDIMSVPFTQQTDHDVHRFKYEYICDLNIDKNKLLLHFSDKTSNLSAFFVTKNKIEVKDLPNTKTLISNMCDKDPKNSVLKPELDDFNNIDIRVEVFVKAEAAYKALDNQISESFKENIQNKSSILIYQSNIEKDSLKILPKVQHFMPLIQLKIEDTLNFKSAAKILNWQIIALESSISLFLKYQKNLSKQMSKSRFFHVPLGNISELDQENLIDVCFQQYMIQNNCLFDIKKDLYLPDCSRELESHLICETPGLYRQPSCHFSMKYLLINSIINAKDLYDATGYDVYNIYQNNSDDEMTIYNEMNPLTSKVFESLQKICTDLYNALSVPEFEQLADNVLQYIEYWLRSDAPVPLKHCANFVMDLQFSYINSFVSEQPFIPIIFDSKSLILSSKLHLSDIDDVEGIFEAFCKTFSSKKELSRIQLSKISIFDVILYNNKSNYVMVKYDKQSNDYFSPLLSTKLSFSSLLHANDFAKKQFELIIIGYIISTSKQYLFRSNSQDAVENQGFATQKINQQLNHIETTAKNLLRNDISKCVFEITEKINEESAGSEQAKIVPQKGIKHLYRSQISLLFTTLLCSFLKLDSFVAEEADELFSSVIQLVDPESPTSMCDIASILHLPNMSALPGIHYFCNDCEQYSCSLFSLDYYLDASDNQFHLHCSNLTCNSKVPVNIIQENMFKFANQSLKFLMNAGIQCENCSDTVYDQFLEKNCLKCLQKLSYPPDLIENSQLLAIYKISELNGKDRITKLIKPFI